jgi:hypothetical protein
VIHNETSWLSKMWHYTLKSICFLWSAISRVWLHALIHHEARTQTKWFTNCLKLADEVHILLKNVWSFNYRTTNFHPASRITCFYMKCRWFIVVVRVIVPQNLPWLLNIESRNSINLRSSPWGGEGVRRGGGEGLEIDITLNEKQVMTTYGHE